ncbi:MAG TPA: TIGR03960 family B12-binding radical SAM protein [Candidatus Hydrogenedentes bacterium]|nr:TIGR03960 family B12-binding radical SAM protein [Candidatus Hydrogenedentota bacterium]HQH52613.1 TIGR03960 family B12-binding radical SAM protein [Candidatus Hydrogenedentota bacterium]
MTPSVDPLLRSRLIDEILPQVERPSRYLGTELNAIHKDPGAVDVRIALAFPDLYDIGLGNLGLLILYAILNELPWCWAERAYAPAPDMEAALRDRQIPLLSHESKTPLRQLDGIGFTLQSELTYTNILNMLDLARVPLRASQRSDDDPLVFAGGPCAFNPEPLAPFMDFFVVGDGEEAVVEAAQALRETTGKPRTAALEALARIEGVYVPALYPVETLSDGCVVPARDAQPVRKRLVRELDAAKYPTKLIVPFTQQVHDRAVLEVLRGCTHGCRFCQAGMTTRPVRERGLTTLDSLLDAIIRETGYEETSLLSLSTCDYSRAQELVHQAAARAAAADMSVSLPSLRLDTFAVDLADKIADIRRSGLTFAPEAATPRLRAVINKWIPDEDLFATAEEVFRRGWKHLKLYFMIGLPTETDEDVLAIVDLCRRTLERVRKIDRGAQINTGVSTFIPKPFTPFQWSAQIGLQETRRRQTLLHGGFAAHRAIRFGRHNPHSSLIEGLITRSDRRAADLLESAWRHGARFDAWDEWRNLPAWELALEDTGFSIEDALRARDPDERLPWDHIDALISKAWLYSDWEAALRGEYAPDCRGGACRNCGLNETERALCQSMWMRAAEAEIEAARAASNLAAMNAERQEPPAVQRLRFRIGRSGEARFLSNHELITVWVRALRRANFPLSYSQGFHAHPRVTFSAAPAVGEESVCDYMDVVLRAFVHPKEAIERLARALPPGLTAFEADTVPIKAPALMASVTGFSYTLETKDDPAALQHKVEELLARPHIEVEREGKKNRRGGRRVSMVNVRPMIKRMAVKTGPAGAVLELEMRRVNARGVRIRELLELLDLSAASVRVTKRATYLAEDE